MRKRPVTEVPTTITILGDCAVSIMFGPSKTNNHFGGTAIYSTHNLVCVEYLI
jgi:hypothetical protein